MLGHLPRLFGANRQRSLLLVRLSFAVVGTEEGGLNRDNIAAARSTAVLLGSCMLLSCSFGTTTCLK